MTEPISVRHTWVPNFGPGGLNHEVLTVDEAIDRLRNAADLDPDYWHSFHVLVPGHPMNEVVAQQEET